MYRDLSKSCDKINLFTGLGRIANILHVEWDKNNGKMLKWEYHKINWESLKRELHLYCDGGILILWFKELWNGFR